MSAFTIPIGAFAIQTLLGQDGSGTRRALQTVSATVDNYSAAYVADLPEPSASRYALVARALPPGPPVTVNVTIHATAADGSTLPPITQQYSLTAPAPPPPAILINPTTPSLGSGQPPADPGIPSATLTAF